MPAYTDPGFHERQEAAARAKSKALAQLRAKPPLDPALAAERTAVRLAREAADAERRLAARQAREEAAAARREAALQAASAAEAAKPVVLTEAERKAARDARYAARKRRKASS